MSKWMPIETAPKDGTPIDLWIMAKGMDGEVISERSWDFRWNGQNHRFESDHWPCTATAKTATHWMPIPEPPEATK